MKEENHQNHNSWQRPAPPRLQADLEALHEPDTDVPPEVDAKILHEARKRAGQAGSRRPRWKGIAAAAAAACVLIFAGALLLPALHQSRQAARHMPTATEDIDGNDKVDILDAYHLARRVESGPAPDEKWDMNGDGTVDRRDADVVARAAVELERGDRR